MLCCFCVDLCQRLWQTLLPLPFVYVRPLPHLFITLTRPLFMIPASAICLWSPLLPFFVFAFVFAFVFFLLLQNVVVFLFWFVPTVVANTFAVGGRGCGGEGGEEVTPPILFMFPPSLPRFFCCFVFVFLFLQNVVLFLFWFVPTVVANTFAVAICSCSPAPPFVYNSNPPIVYDPRLPQPFVYYPPTSLFLFLFLFLVLVLFLFLFLFLCKML